MKKNQLLTFCLLCLGLSLQAQNPAMTPNFKPIHKIKGNGEPIRPNKLAGTPSSFWINYGWIEDSINGGLSVLNGNYLFPDSTVYVDFGGTLGHPWIHCISDVLDVSDPDFQNYNGYMWNSWNSYDIDSMSVEYAYERHSALSVVDTMIVTLFNDAVASNLKTAHWTGSTGWNTNFNVDTLFVKIPKYSPATNAPVAVNAVTFKVPLREADTSVTFFGFKYFSAHSFAVPAGKLACATVSFKPGYVYHSKDTLAKNGENIFNFASYEENGNSTFPTYKKGHWNSSGIIPTTVRYNDDSQGWDSAFVPTYLYTAPFGLERHQIYYKVRGTNLGVNENKDNLSLLAQNYPNPFSQLSVINYELAEHANIRLEIRDMVGRCIAVPEEGNRQAGNHTVYLDGSKLTAGVYFYSLMINNQSVLTKRMVVYH